MFFCQLFEPLSSACTCRLGCERTGKTMLIDPVNSAMDRNLAKLQRLGLKLVIKADTHVHADHITAARALTRNTSSKIALRRSCIALTAASGLGAKQAE